MIDRTADSSHPFVTEADTAAEFDASDGRMLKAVGFTTKHSFSNLNRFEFERAPAKANEVELGVLFCGVWHSDIHQVRNEWSNTVDPCLPGHEIVGRITQVGSAVTRHRVGDLVGVGCMIDSCGACGPCQAGDENDCEGPNSWLATYNGPMIPAAKTINMASLEAPERSTRVSP